MGSEAWCLLALGRAAQRAREATVPQPPVGAASSHPSLDAPFTNTPSAPSAPSAHSCRALDLVAIGFAKPARFYGNTITNKDELLQAAAAFKARGRRPGRSGQGAGGQGAGRGDGARHGAAAVAGGARGGGAAPKAPAGPQTPPPKPLPLNPAP
jgi:hypothetical protein